MEDSCLDDFFAKKDKKKKQKSAGADDDGTKKKDKTKKANKDKVNSNSSSRTSENNKPYDEDWKDFEEEKAADYSDLKVQTLKTEAEKETDDEKEELDENGEVKERKDTVSGPWNKTSTTPAPAPAKKEEKKAAPAPASTGKYIPPSQRAGAAAALGASSMPKSRSRKKELPNMNSEMDFPTLAPGTPSSQEQPSQNNTVTNQRKAVTLTLENKFSVLGD